MCGIGGFSNFKEDYLYKSEYYKDVLNKMAITLSKRGPDAKGIYLDKHVGLSHARLSIRDLTDGWQPMTSRYDNYIIVYNGEIYNTSEIKNDLIDKGYIFNTTSDTEVVLKAFIEYEEKSVELLNGIFAYAIYDYINDRLFLFRDKFGVKPLYYTIQNDTLIFSSEIKGLNEHPSVKLRLDTDSFREIFGVFPSRTEGNGVFKNIHEVKYGSYGVFDRTGYREYRYWELKSHENKYSFREAVEMTRELVENAVKRQMVSDVPISTFLSGGLDSTIVTGIINNELKKEGKTLDTYSFDYEENSLYFVSNFFQVDEDKKWVKKVVDLSNTNHTYLECGINELVECLYIAVDAKDYPGMADIDSSLLYFCGEVSKKHKVVLTGECADEIFGGYPWFHSEEAFKNNGFPWIRDFQTRKALLNEDFSRTLDLENYVLNRYENTIKEVPVLYGESATEKRRREITYLNIKWFMTTLLERMDRTSMYNSLEARVPYCDYEIVEFMWNIPWEYKYNGRVKNILREAFKDLFPDEIINRKKSPYPKTYNPKYEMILKERLGEILSTNNSPIIPLIDKNKFSDFLKADMNTTKPWFGQLMAGPQLLAYYIQLDYWMRKYNLTI